MARRTHSYGPASPVVLVNFTGTALVWFIPAALLLPLVLLLLAVSVAAADGSLLEIGAGIRGRVLTALGPLLVASGVAAVVLAWMYGASGSDWIGAGAFAGLAIVGGVVAIRHALRRIARELSRGR